MKERERFDADGFVRVPAAVAAGDIAAMRACVLEMAAGLTFVEVAGALRPAPGSEAKLWQVGRGAAFAALPAAMRRAAAGVFGDGVWEPIEGDHGGLAAPNLPIPGVWAVPHLAWHVDEPTAAGQARGWGLLGFVFLDEVGREGGATVVIAGSHRRLGVLAGGRPGGLVTTDEALACLSREAWFAALFAPGEAGERRRYLDEVYVSAGVLLRVAELTGMAGDIVLMDPRCLHTVSANTSPRPRLTMRMTCARRP